MSSTETMARSSLCFSGCSHARCHLSVLRSAAIPMVLGLLLIAGSQPCQAAWSHMALHCDSKGRFGMTLSWAESSCLLAVSALRSPGAAHRDSVIGPAAMAEPA